MKNPWFAEDGKMIHTKGEVLKLGVAIWTPFVCEDLEPDKGVHIGSKRQYKEECKKRNLTCRGLL